MPLLDLTVSNPTKCGFSYDRVILEALTKPGSLIYDPEPHGFATARKAIAEYYLGRGSEVSIDDIFLTTSTSEAYSFVFRLLCDPGDELLIPAPSYPLFEFLSEIQDVKIVRYPLVYDHGWQMECSALERAMTRQTRGVIVVHPNNPTGHYIKRGEAEYLKEICAVRGIALIADEVFLDFSLSGTQPVSFAASRRALTFTLSGLSKISGLPQMKASWLAVGGPESLRVEATARLEVIADTYLSVNAPVQLAIPAFFEQRLAFQNQLLSRVRTNLAELDSQLARQKLCSRLEMEGGWYAVLRVPATRPDEELAVELLTQHGVYAHPGHFYDFPSDGFLVVSLITPCEDFAKGMNRLLSMF